MASKLGLMLKREAVDNRLRDATNKLKSRGVDAGSFPDEQRDRDLKEYERVEHTASLLEACVERLDELLGANKPKDEPDPEPTPEELAEDDDAETDGERAVPALRRGRRS